MNDGEAEERQEINRQGHHAPICFEGRPVAVLTPLDWKNLICMYIDLYRLGSVRLLSFSKDALN